MKSVTRRPFVNLPVGLWFTKSFPQGGKLLRKGVLTQLLLPESTVESPKINMAESVLLKGRWLCGFTPSTVNRRLKAMQMGRSRRSSNVRGKSICFLSFLQTSNDLGDWIYIYIYGNNFTAKKKSQLLHIYCHNEVGKKYYLIEVRVKDFTKRNSLLH